MKALDVIFYVAAITAIIGLPFFVFNWLFYMINKARFHRSPSTILEKRLPLKSLLFFAVPVALALCVGTLSELIAHQRVLHEINSIGDDSRVSIEGQRLDNSKNAISILRTLRWVMPHHSDPTKRIHVEISDGSKNIALVLARDSHNPTEYWVYYPKYRITTLNEIGRIYTTLFDEY